MEHINSSDDDSNATLPFDIPNTSLGVRIFFLVGGLLCLFVSGLIIILNTLYIMCLYINRKKNWFSYSKNILSIVVVDLIVGITSFWLTITSAMPNIGFYPCFIGQSLCMATQVAHLFNILRICILRMIAARSDVLRKEPTALNILCQTLATYALSCAVCIAPIYAWSTYSPVLPQCTWSFIFRENELLADTYFLSMFIVHTVVTTSCYSALFFYIRKKQMSIFPDIRHSNKPQVWVSTKKSSILSLSRKIDSADKQDVVREISKAFTSESEFPCTSSSNDGSNRISVLNTENNIPTKHATLTRVRDRPNMSYQQRRITTVMKTIGATLICANISVAPYVTMLAVKVTQSREAVNPFFGFLTSFFLILNSVADPFIYTVNFKHLKEAYKNMLKRLNPCRRR